MMLTQKISKELALLSLASQWLKESEPVGGSWRSEPAKLAHLAKCKLNKESSIGRRFQSGEVCAENLVDALSFEFQRLSEMPDLLRSALNGCEYPTDFERRGRKVLADLLSLE